MSSTPSPDPFAGDDADPPLFPRGLLLVPWLMWTFAMPVAVGVGVAVVQGQSVETQRSRTAKRRAARMAKTTKVAQVNAGRSQQSRLMQQAQLSYQEGDPARAVALLDTYLAAEPEAEQAHWYRGLAHFDLGNLPEAEADFSAVLATGSQGGYAYSARGQVRALLGRKQEAFVDYHAALDEDASRAYPAIWLAGLGAGDEQLRPFASGTQWISEVARYYVGRLSEEELLARAEAAPDEGTRQDQLCEAYGYMGLLAERDGDLPKALENYRLCVETDVTNFIEYRWAKIRLEQETATGEPEKE